MQGQGYTVTRAPVWTVHSRTRHGKDHHVVDVGDGILECSCETGQYNRSCWHRDWVRDGRAGKPTIRIRPQPKPAPAPRLAVDDLYADAVVSGPIVVRR